MTPIEWDECINYKDGMFLGLLGVTDRLERIVLVLSDLFWRFLVGSESPEPLTRSQANDLILFAISSRGMTVERAEQVAPELTKRLSNRYGTTDLVEGLLVAGVDGIHEAMTQEPMLHRYNHETAKSAYAMAVKLRDEYEGDGRCVWESSPPLTGETLMKRILEFRGLGQKTGTMLFRILTIAGPDGSSGVVLSDGIQAGEISPDVHCTRVFKRLGLVSQDAAPIEVMKAARELATQYNHEAIEMDGAFHLGRKICFANSPDCTSCPMSENSVCDYPWQLQPEVIQALKDIK